jgi:hypothetical protein
VVVIILLKEVDYMAEVRMNLINAVISYLVSGITGISGLFRGNNVAL